MKMEGGKGQEKGEERGDVGEGRGDEGEECSKISFPTFLRVSSVSRRRE